MVTRDPRVRESEVAERLRVDDAGSKRQEERSRAAAQDDIAAADLVKAGRAAQRWWSILARSLRFAYTSGEDLAALGRRLDQVVTDTGEAFRRLARHQAVEPRGGAWLRRFDADEDPSTYAAFVDLLAWAVCLDSLAAARQLLAVPLVAEADDAVIAELAVLAGARDARTTDRLVYPELWGDWIAVVDGGPDDRPANLATYVHHWLAARVRAGYESEPAGEGFLGAWCFDAAALAVAYDIDDTACRDVLEYPSGLVDYARSLRDCPEGRTS